MCSPEWWPSVAAGSPSPTASLITTSPSPTVSPVASFSASPTESTQTRKTPNPPSSTPTRSLNPIKGSFDCDALRKGSPKVRNCGDIHLVAYEGLNLDSKANDWGRKEDRK